MNAKQRLKKAKVGIWAQKEKTAYDINLKSAWKNYNKLNQMRGVPNNLTYEAFERKYVSEAHNLGVDLDKISPTYKSSSLKNTRQFSIQFADDYSRGDFAAYYDAKPKDAKSKAQVEKLYQAAKRAGLDVKIEDIYKDPDAYYTISDAIKIATGMTTAAEINFYMFGS